MAKLHRNIDGKDKYLVLNRRGKKPEGETFVLKACDPCAVTALKAYTEKAIELGLDLEYTMDLEEMAQRWADALAIKGEGDPDAPPEQNQLARPDNDSITEALLAPGGTTYKVTRIP